MLKDVIRKITEKVVKKRNGMMIIEYVLILSLISTVLFAGLRKVINGYNRIHNSIIQSVDQSGSE